MHATIQKPIQEIVNTIKPGEKVFVVGCNNCAWKCHSGGEDETKAMAEQAVLAGKDVIFYKAGRTPEGKTATSGHTASLAGDYMVCESCVSQAGGIALARRRPMVPGHRQGPLPRPGRSGTGDQGNENPGRTGTQAGRGQ